MDEKQQARAQEILEQLRRDYERFDATPLRSSDRLREAGDTVVYQIQGGRMPAKISGTRVTQQDMDKYGMGKGPKVEMPKGGISKAGQQTGGKTAGKREGAKHAEVK